METVGIRDLKAHLSRHLKRVRSGTRLVVTERGRAVATLGPVEPVEPGPAIRWALGVVSGGRADWSGGKPAGPRRALTLTSGPTLADTILEDRR